jgi:hypothetical protein
VREYAALAFHLGSLVMRYYSAPLVAAGLPHRAVVPLGALALIAAYYGYRQHELRMGLPVFAGLYGLEMLACQAGVWRAAGAGAPWRHCGRHCGCVSDRAGTSQRARLARAQQARDLGASGACRTSAGPHERVAPPRSAPGSPAAGDADHDVFRRHLPSASRSIIIVGAVSGSS